MLFIDKKLTALVKILKEDPTEKKEETRKHAIEIFSKSIVNSVRGGKLTIEHIEEYGLEIIFKLKTNS